MSRNEVVQRELARLAVQVIEAYTPIRPADRRSMSPAAFGYYIRPRVIDSGIEVLCYDPVEQGRTERQRHFVDQIGAALIVVFSTHRVNIIERSMSPGSPYVQMGLLISAPTP